ncbi:MAG TPA: MFS transporter [Dehalococcoidales bacterium]|nr:MFS transporter [Dehalococcoidales bacterium]
MPKKFYYGYAIVAAATIILMVVYSSYYSYSIFFDSLAEYFKTTKAAISGAFSMTVIISGALSMFAGSLSDRLSPRIITIFSGACLGLGLLAMSQVHAIWHVYAIYGVLFAIGVGGLFPAVVSTVARWFTDKRGLMLGVVTAGLGVGSIVLSPLTSKFIIAYDWRWAYAILGFIVLAVIFAAAPFLKRPKTEALIKISPASSLPPIKSTFSFRQAASTRQFWMLVAAYVLSGYGQFSLMVHIVPYATGMQINALSAATLLSIIGGTSIFGRLIVGGVSDRVKVKPLLIGIGAALLIAIFWLEFSRNYWSLVGVAIIFGLGYGGSSTMQSLVAVEMFGLSSLGVMLGAFIFSICIGGSIGPVVTGFLYDQSARYSAAANYNLSFMICTIAAAASLFIILLLTPAKVKK